MNNIGVILAAGSGTRMQCGSTLPKQFQELRGKPLIAHSIETFNQCNSINTICIVISEQWNNYAIQILKDIPKLKEIDIIFGGTERHYSCHNAVNHYSWQDERVTNLLFHDAARPLLSMDLLDNVCQMLLHHSAVTPIIPCTDTIWMLNPEEQTLGSSLNRNELGCAQTPQGFRLELLKKAYAWYETETNTSELPTDTCGLILKAFPECKIHHTQGELRNIKITSTFDLKLADCIIG